MNKTLKAWLHGYVAFNVNGERFWRYNSANARADSLKAGNISVSFIGFHAFKGWRTFLLFWTREERAYPTISTSYTCPRCGMTSYHPEDVKHRYCGNCHQFED